MFHMVTFASPDHLLILVFFGLICWAALRDAMSFRIPNWVSLGILLLYPLHVLTSATPVDWQTGLVTAGLVFLAGFLVFAKGICGGGDVKLLSAAALWAGTTLLFPLIMVMALTGGVLSGAAWLSNIQRKRRGQPQSGETPDLSATHVPYGMAISFGAALVGLHLLNS
jgi:prepilin peptidase CpaA